MHPALSIVYALLAGLLPALLWLWLFRREDSTHPEPRPLILLSFIGGMVAVAFVIPVERFSLGFLVGTPLIIAWAAAEEIFKLMAAYLTVLWRSSVDEPIDAMIYMITVALGFAAAENALFVLGPLLNEDFTRSILTGNLRFLGASLLHVLSSSVIGLSLALSFYMKSSRRHWYLLTGTGAAIALHALFNFFIIGSTGAGVQEVFRVFYFVWVGIIILFLFFEKVKRIARPH